MKKTHELDYLFTDSSLYLWRRLRYFAFRASYLTALRWIEFSAVAILWKPRFSFLYLAARYGTQIISSYRWGNLEHFRQDMAKLNMVHNKNKVYQAVQVQWRNSLFGTFLIISAGLLLMLFSLVQSSSQDIVVYLTTAIFIIQNGIQWSLKAVQSFVYSRKRVYRPTWAVLVVDIAPTLFLILFSMKFGLYALPVTLLFETLIKSYVSGYFTLKSFRHLNLSSLSVKFRAPSFKFKNFFLGFNYLLTEILILMVTIWAVKIFLETQFPEIRLKQLKAIYTLLPLILTIFSVRFLFYVDLIRFKPPVFFKVYKVVKSQLTKAIFCWGLYVAFVVFFVITGLKIPFRTSHLLMTLVIYFLWAFYFKILFTSFIEKESWKKDLILFLSIGALFIPYNEISFWITISSIPILGIVVNRLFFNHQESQHTAITSLSFLTNHIPQDKTCFELSFTEDTGRDYMRYIISELDKKILQDGFFVLINSRKLLYCGREIFPKEEFFSVCGHRLLCWKEKKMVSYHSKQNRIEIGEWKIGEVFPYSYIEENSVFKELVRLCRGETYRNNSKDFYFVPTFQGRILSGMKLFKKTI